MLYKGHRVNVKVTSIGNNSGFIIALHGIQTRFSDENFVCMSVERVTKRKKDLSRFLYRTKDHLA